MASVARRLRLADEEKVIAATRHFSELAAENGISAEFRIIWDNAQGDAATLRALQCDLIIAAHPKLADLPSDWSAEQLLLVTGTPVLLVPIAWQGEAIGDTVLIAWNRSREARRAVNDAIPFITPASGVVILVVDGDRDAERYGEEPGLNLVDHLSRHGIGATITCVSSEGASIAEKILDQATKGGADLLVIGAYSHPRTTQLLFGGVTRSLLSQARLPLLIPQ